MSKSSRKKSHWTSRVHESVIGRNQQGQLGFDLRGGAEHGQFPYLGEVRTGQVVYNSGTKLVAEELLLEVNETPVAGLTLRDVLAVIKHCKDPIRLKCVRQGKGGAALRRDQPAEQLRAGALSNTPPSRPPNPSSTLPPPVPRGPPGRGRGRTPGSGRGHPPLGSDCGSRGPWWGKIPS
uniref:PDZ domain-containing protein n=1 Tax=Ornithorhynchus anatinus TaxID=9258 RepID=F7FSD9_ORNAN